MQGVRESLDDLQKQAVAYDDKYAGSRGQHAVDTLHGMVNSGRQRATEALETANEELVKLKEAIENMAGQATYGAQVAVGEAVRAAEYGDEKLGVSSKAGGVVQRLHDLDARLGVTATAAKVDTKVTGGLGCKVAATTVDMVTESVSYISETLHNAKLAAQQSETAQSVEAKGAAVTGAAVAKKNEVQETFNQAYEKGRETAGMTTKKTEETAGATKEKAGEMTDKTKEKTGEAAEMAKDKVGMAKEKAGDVKEMAQEKAGDMKESAKDKAGMAKEKASKTAGQATDKAGDMKESAKDKAGDAKEKTKETAGQTTEKTGEKKEQSKGVFGRAFDKTKEAFGSAADTAKSAGTRTEAKATKPKEPTTTQEQTSSEKALEGLKQTGAKESEAAKTSAGTARQEMHGKQKKVDETAGEAGATPGFKQAQQHAAKCSK
jgi:hypothetical protein